MLLQKENEKSNESESEGYSRIMKIGSTDLKTR